MKKNFFFILTTLIAFYMMAAPSYSGEAPSAQEQQFFQAMNDLPLMPGLYEVSEDSVIFDKPDGRIIESRAVSQTLTSPQIRAFYEQALPQTGWTRLAPDVFTRQKEILTLEISEENGKSAIRFMISPQRDRT